MTAPRVSVVVPVRDREDSVGDLLQGLDSQTLQPDRFEVIVVDDGSVDGSRKVIEAWVSDDREHRKLVRGYGRGPAHARNLGISEATGAWVAFTDSDTFPDETWLEAGLKAAEHYGTQALEGNVMTWPPSAIGPYTHQIRSGDGGRFMTANMFYRRTLLEEVGGFDERFEAPFLEDSDLAFRVLDAGYRIPYAPEVVVRHRVERQSFTDVHRGAKKLRWLALLAAKHPERYRTDFRPLMRPLSHIDIDVIVALAACVAIPRSKGLARAALIATAANGIRRGFASGQVLTAPKGERLQRAALSLSVPVSRAFWWLEGSVRYRTFVS